MVSGKKIMRRVICNKMGNGSDESDEAEEFNI